MPSNIQDYRHSNAYARNRDAKAEWLLGQHPVTAGILAALGWFPSRAKARKRLARLAARGRIRLVGTVSRAPGRPEHVYCRGWRPKADSLLHEVELTEFCLGLDAARIDRGPHATDPAVRPDAEVRIYGRVYYLEWDRGSMGYAQIVRRFRAYAGCPHLVLWVCPTAERREGLRSRAADLRSTALFTTAAEALASPHGPIWLDYHGGRAALPRQAPAAAADRADDEPGDPMPGTAPDPPSAGS
jgi:hypothetical protein